MVHAQKIPKEPKTLTFIFASEMPDITDPESGRYAELKHVVDQQRAKNPYSFFIFGGGSIGPSALANLDRGSHIIDLLNGLEPDVMGVAKREYSFFEDELSLRAYEAAFPIVSSNTIDKRINSVPDGLVDYALITKGEVTVGVLSIIHSRLVYEYLLKHIDVQSPIDVVRSKSKKLRALGADYVVLHHFYSFDFIPNILQEGIIDLAYESNTLFSINDDASKKAINNAIATTKPGEAIVVTVTLGNKNEVKQVKRITLKDHVADVSTQHHLSSYQLRLDRLLNIRIGFWDGNYTTSVQSLRTGENAFGNYVADTMRNFANADIALVNGGSIRGDRTYQTHSSITRRTIATELPYRSTLSVLAITGEDLEEALENSFAGIDERQGSFLHVSGMRVTFDSTAPAGQRVRKVTINQLPLQKDKVYRLATTDYLADGGDEFFSLTRATVLKEKRVQESILISDLVLREIQLRGKLQSRLDGRMLDVSKGRQND
ncbi:bifunctional metallophosphatase/5'-nucleotidase [Glaciecola petra]|uniref:5'-nucleotidase C-terminal domain-containing protein n=1 Tax=Glaciecola petra TaxID=3075602 RepID=A0ABU2ZLP3_9ALTE|nr:5'-nucleotidase C-terminal domain-containing protein [Aestuariibacter sp. P117]MDT0593550.1 5'-nucleotidase C-terminal domain-containing protein [Aestuariibacter sp. P117]